MAMGMLTLKMFACQTGSFWRAGDLITWYNIIPVTVCLVCNRAFIYVNQVNVERLRVLYKLISATQESGRIISYRLYFLGLQNHCRWWLQAWNEKKLAPWKKSYTNLDSILKSRDITLPTKVRLFKAMVFPVVMHGCESWTIKKAEHWEIDAFELWC